MGAAPTSSDVCNQLDTTLIQTLTSSPYQIGHFQHLEQRLLRVGGDRNNNTLRSSHKKKSVDTSQSESRSWGTTHAVTAERAGNIGAAQLLHEMLMPATATAAEDRANPHLPPFPPPVPAPMSAGFSVTYLSAPVPLGAVAVRAAPPLRLVCVSDTHGHHAMLPPSAVPAGDVLVHTGDFTNKGTTAEVASFDAWLAALPHARKLLVGGNHECGVFAEFRPTMLRDGCAAATYLDNETVTIGGVSFYGSPWNKRGSRQVPVAPAVAGAAFACRALCGHALVL